VNSLELTEKERIKQLEDKVSKLEKKLNEVERVANIAERDSSCNRIIGGPTR
jgi:hypothetical protein